jgi:hypothetical protein
MRALLLISKQEPVRLRSSHSELRVARRQNTPAQIELKLSETKKNTHTDKLYKRFITTPKSPVKDTA